MHVAQDVARRLDYELPEWLEFLEDSVLDDQPLKALMDEYLVSDGLETGLPLYVSIYKSNGGLTDLLSAFKAELGFIDTPNSEFVHIQSTAPAERKKLLLASAAIPMLFKPRTIEGQRYTDGGQGGWQTMQGNTPITPLLNAGCNLVIVTHLSDGSPWSRHDFPGATILEIRPSESLNRAQGPLGALVIFLASIMKRSHPGLSRVIATLSHASAKSWTLRRVEMSCVSPKPLWMLSTNKVHRPTRH
ncbi:patatin-like phospholipase family protein [Pseudomonas sp. 273]|uniref:patatin-like phospholipase family protein n=1 Tax=Pseudomonas sp. 273 TaxID=75692 RepID=UPI0023D828CF|nr:patatin-like phospholipase family protein [Pseudomonas sp. 273]